MSDTERHWMEYRQKNYRKKYRENYSGTGMFVMKKRKQLLGFESKTGKAQAETAKKRSLANFNYDVRENVKLGLIDLQLFIESSEVKEVDTTITRKALQEVFDVLLSRSQSSNEKLKIAQLLVNHGLEYIKEHAPITDNQKRLFDDTIETSKQLAYLMLPKDERDDIGWYVIK